MTVNREKTKTKRKKARWQLKADSSKPGLE